MIINTSSHYMLKDPGPHSKFKMSIFRIVEIFENHIKLNNGVWYDENSFERKFIRVIPRDRKKNKALPLFEKIQANA